MKESRDLSAKVKTNNHQNLSDDFYSSSEYLLSDITKHGLTISVLFLRKVKMLQTL